MKQTIQLQYGEKITVIAPTLVPSPPIVIFENLLGDKKLAEDLLTDLRETYDAKTETDKAQLKAFAKKYLQGDNEAGKAMASALEDSNNSKFNNSHVVINSVAVGLIIIGIGIMLL